MFKVDPLFENRLLYPPCEAFGIYLHWPFCASKCPYCDFNSHVRHKGVNQEAFVEGFIKEIHSFAAMTPERTVDSIFFGGGTPSLMHEDTVARLLETINECWPVSAQVEITLEANPNSVETRRFEGYRRAGVNRVSIGVQSLHDHALKQLGRRHSSQEALRAIECAQNVFERVSLDLIYARPGQTLSDWEKELKKALDLNTSHLSLYQLTIEPGTRFYDLHKQNKLKIPDETLATDLFDLTQELCAAHGLPAYEVSNHARAGEQSRHNLVYWRSGEFVGVGPGAHGRLNRRLGRYATTTYANPEIWLSRAELTGSGVQSNLLLRPEDVGDEYLLMGLRLLEGVDKAVYKDLTGRDLKSHRLYSLQEQGLIHLDGKQRISITAQGMPVLDFIVAEIAM